MKGAKKKFGKLKGKAAKRDAKKASRSAGSKEERLNGIAETSPGFKMRGKPEKPKMNAKRKGKLEGNLRHEPVVFVKADNQLEFKLLEEPSGSSDSDALSSDESSDESSEDLEDDIENTIEKTSQKGLEDSSQNGVDDVREASAETTEPAPVPFDSRDTTGNASSEATMLVDVPESETIEAADEMANEVKIEGIPETTNETTFGTASGISSEPQNETSFIEISGGEASFDHPMTAAPNPSQMEEITVDSMQVESTQAGSDSDEDLLGSMNDEELDALISKEHDNSMRGARIEQAYLPPVVHEQEDSEIDSASDAEIGLDSYGQDLNFGDEDVGSSAESEVNEDEFTRITLEDHEVSDADSAVQDYIDNMSDLDDDQIFALASGQMKQNGVHEFEDMDAFDRYDEYDEYFDELLDQDHSLTPKQNGVSDRKKLKRQAREMMHAMKFGKEPLLWRRYTDEIHVREVLAELRNFATQSGASLAFPPLDHNANWYVKQLAEEHGMRPTVEGSHTQKYVVAHRTRRTNSKGGKGLNKLLTRRQVFRRSDMRDMKAARKDGKDGKPTGARIRHGYVVGQDAAQITGENFGHRLMRQMGWQEGSGLGRERAGIVNPIGATVKLTKTGLGGV